LAEVESRFRQEVKDLHESYNDSMVELNEKNKTLEKDCRDLKDNLHIIQRDCQTGAGNLEQKVIQMEENEKRLISELEQVKYEREESRLGFHKQLEKEKEVLKGKISELETRCKEAENKKSH
jgi:uncharacterized phage infection (PIP) family protein YhgE